MKILGAVLMVLGALLGLLVLCLVMPARLRVVLKQGQWRLWAGMGPVMITLWPRKQKKKKRFRQNKKEQDQQEPAAAKAEKPAVKPEEPAASAPVVQQAPPSPGSDGDGPNKWEKSKTRRRWTMPAVSVETLCDFGRLALDAMGQMARVLVLRRLQVHAVIASGDAAHTALAYGSAAASLNLFLPALEEKIRIRRQDVAVECDFETYSPQIELDIEVAARLGALLIVGLRVAYRFVQLYRRDN